MALLRDARAEERAARTYQPEAEQVVTPLRPEIRGRRFDDRLNLRRRELKEVAAEMNELQQRVHETQRLTLSRLTVVEMTVLLLLLLLLMTMMSWLEVSMPSFTRAVSRAMKKPLKRRFL